METTKSDWVFVVKQADIPVAGARVIEGAAAGPIAIFRSLDDVVAHKEIVDTSACQRPPPRAAV